MDIDMNPQGMVRPVAPPQSDPPGPPRAPAEARRSILEKRLAAATGLSGDEAREELEQTAREAADAPAYPLMQTLCRTLADPRRLLIATLLKRQGDLSATELQAALTVAQPTISHHLSVLKAAGLIVATPDGKWVRYRLDARYERLIP